MHLKCLKFIFYGRVRFHCTRKGRENEKKKELKEKYGREGTGRKERVVEWEK